MKKITVFSGIRPSGNLTIGNYIGAIQQWIGMQNRYSCIYSIADLHAITDWRNDKTLRDVSLDLLATYLACGIDPNKSLIFIQSHVPEHSQLSWILNCYVPFGRLSRMHQFRTKSVLLKKKTIVGLLNYPILMASDILLYKSNYVPIGEDQKQHLEFTTSIANRFNSTYGKIFTVPKPIMSENGMRIMSLLNPRKKMSKSDEDKKNIILLFEDSESIRRKIDRSITDSDNPPIIRYDPISKPGISNLLNMFSCLSGCSLDEAEKHFSGKTYTYFKQSLSDTISNIFEKLKERYRTFRQNEVYLYQILREHSEKARVRARKVLDRVHKAIGLL